MINFGNNDLRLTRSLIIDPRIKIEIYSSDNKYIDSIKGGLVEGALSISADSDVRRTISASFTPNNQFDIKIREGKYLWIDKYVLLFIGFYDPKINEEVWYKQGKYIFTDASITYDATNNQVSINASDLVAKLNDTSNGALGQQVIEYPAYEEDEEGNVIKYNLIRDALITTLTQLGRVKLDDLEIDEIGEYNAIPNKNTNWEEYREYNPLWNVIPYDLNFSAGCSVWSIVQELINLYPDYEAFFDEDAKFRVQMIPDCYDDITFFNDGFLNEILVSENTSIDFTPVRNISEVWGKIIDNVEWYATEGVTLTGGTYIASIPKYGEETDKNKAGYYSGDLIALKIPSDGGKNINVNNLGSIPIYDENTETVIESGLMLKDETYVFKIKKKSNGKNEDIRAYFLGQWQPHGICVLTDGTVGDEYVTTGDVKVNKYSKKYFQEVYNCETVQFTIIPDSPFTVQKIGERLGVYDGGEFENITSNALAVARAEWELYKTTRLTDNVNITVKYMPYMDVNIKVQFQEWNDDEPHEYICKSVTHDFANGTTTLGLIKFYPLYIPTDNSEEK